MFVSVVYACYHFFVFILFVFFFFKQKTAYEMRISDWSSDVCSSDLAFARFAVEQLAGQRETFRSARDAVVRETVEGVRVIGREIGRASCRERVCQYV